MSFPNFSLESVPHPLVTGFEPWLVPPNPDDPPSFYVQIDLAFSVLLDMPVGSHIRLRPESQALILSSTYVGLPSLTARNLAEWAYRISSLADAGIHFLDHTTPEGIVPQPLYLETLISHQGITFPDILSPLPPSLFDLSIRNHRLTAIHTFLAEQPPCSPPPTLS